MKPKLKKGLLATANTCGKVTKGLSQVLAIVVVLGAIATLSVDIAERKEKRKKIEEYNKLSNKQNKRS